MRIVGYTRERPLASGAESAFGQAERIRRMASDHGHLPVAVCTDAHAADGVPDRPGFRSLLAVLAAGTADAVVIADLEALADDLTAQEVLLHRIRSLGAAVLSCEPADEKELTDEPADAARREMRRTFRTIDEVAATLDS